MYRLPKVTPNHWPLKTHCWALHCTPERRNPAPPTPGYAALWDSKTPPQTHQWEGFLVFGNFSSFMTPSPGKVSVPNSFVSLFVLYILSYFLSKRMGCLSGCLVFSASIQKLFCESCSTFKWSFDELVGEKVVSPSYSSIFLGLPSCFTIINNHIDKDSILPLQNFPWFK